MNTTYSPALVAISVLVAILASYVALDLAGRVTAARGRARRAWLLGGSVAMGVGIWSMHFIGMLALHLPVPIAYDVPLWLLSVAVAVLASLLALFVASRTAPGLPSLLAAGLLMGAAIAGMHYIGMAAMHIQGRIGYRPVLVAVSVLVAVAASFAALRLALRFREDETGRGRLGRVGSAVVMGFAIVGMHYTAMAAARFTHAPGMDHRAGSDLIATRGLGLAVVAGALLILGLALVSARIDRRIRRTEEARSRVEDQAAELEVLMEELQQQASELEENQADLEAANEELQLANAELLRQREEAEQARRAAMQANAALRAEIQRRVGSEERLRASRESYLSLFDNLTEAVYLLDLDGRFLEVNEAVVRMYGYARDEVVGQTPAMLADPERVDLDETARLLRDAAAGEAQRFEWWGRRKSGETFPKEVVVTRATYQGRDVLLAVARDVTERKEAEEALRRSEEQLLQVQKMEAIGRLSGGVAHDFNNLLTVITGNTQMLLLDTPEESPAREDLVEIKRAADRAAMLTRQLLAFSRKQMLQPRILDLNAVVTGTDKMLRRLIGADVELVTVLAPELGRIRADAGQLEQVLLNLAVNARDAMSGGGKLVIETRNREWPAPGVRRYPFVQAGEYIELQVEDTGTGIAEELRERIFEPFFTTKARGEGTGLGLSTVYGIVKQSGGFIWVESEPGRGSTFTILLPRVEAELPDAAPESAPVRATGGWETILLVEDEQTVRNVAHRVLMRQGYTVLEAANGEEGLRVLEQFGLPIHLVLTDVVMPLMGGRHLAERARQRRPGIPVLFMSGYTDDSLEDSSEPGTGFLQKPFDPDTLAGKVREMLDSPRAGPLVPALTRPDV